MTATTSVRIRTVDWRRVATPAMWGLMLAFFLMVPGSAFGQEYVLVPERQTHTDVKQGSSSGSVVLVLVPKGTALPLIKRQGEWIQVKLSPELRKTGIPMRWYKNEDAGWVHESTVEVRKGTPPAPPQQPPPTPGQEHVRVPPRQTHTDIKQGAGSGSVVLVLVPSGTVLPVLKRQGEWIQVKLSPELRKVGIPMRWYKNEEAGFYTSPRWK